MSRTVGHGKGSLLIHTRDYVIRASGQSGWLALVEGALAADREVLGGILLAGSWYPIGVVNRLADRVCTASDKLPDDEMRRLSAFIADRDLGSVYKMIIGLGSPSFLVKRTGSLWNRYFDVGVLTPSELSERRWRLCLEMPLGDELAPNRLFCGPGCPAWIEMGLKLTGAEACSVRHVECRFDNGTHCEYAITW